MASEVGEEIADFDFSHGIRVFEVVEPDEPFDPEPVCIFSSLAQVSESADGVDLINEELCHCRAPSLDGSYIMISAKGREVGKRFCENSQTPFLERNSPYWERAFATVLWGE